jgi:cytoskeleton protein RodZ
MQELAELLKIERLKQNLTLEKVSEQTNLSVRMLHALEEGKFEKVGAPLLIGSFVRTYCLALGIDPEPLLKKHASQILCYDLQKKGIERYGEWAKSLRKKKPLGMFATLFLVTIGMSGLYGWIWLSAVITPVHQSTDQSVFIANELPSDLSSSVDTTSNPPSPEVVAAVEERRVQHGYPWHGFQDALAASPLGGHLSSSAPDIASTIDSEESPGAGALEVKKHLFVIEVDRKTWIQVKTDAMKPQSHMLQAGDRREWEVEGNAEIALGHADGVRMMWDSQAVDFKSRKALRFQLPDDVQNTSQKKRDVP